MPFGGIYTFLSAIGKSFVYHHREVPGVSHHHQYREGKCTGYGQDGTDPIALL